MKNFFSNVKNLKFSKEDITWLNYKINEELKPYYDEAIKTHLSLAKDAMHNMAKLSYNENNADARFLRSADITLAHEVAHLHAIGERVAKLAVEVSGLTSPGEKDEKIIQNWQEFKDNIHLESFAMYTNIVSPLRTVALKGRKEPIDTLKDPVSTQETHINDALRRLNDFLSPEEKKDKMFKRYDFTGIPSSEPASWNELQEIKKKQVSAAI